jgi:hypothetical protein
VMRSFLLAVLIGVSLSLVAAPAHGKSGVRARLNSSAPLAAEPGEKVTLKWTLGYRDEWQRWRPRFDACGVFVRLLSASGARPTVGFDSDGACRTHPGGNYAATVEVPEGGVGAIKIGLRGTTEVFFPLDRGPREASAAAPGPTLEVASATSLPVRLLLGLACAAVAALALAAAVRPRRAHSDG